jgi:DNA-binding XRE family transcriptional regulator
MIRKGNGGRKAKRSVRVLSEAERSRLGELRGRLDAEKDEIVSEARLQKAAHDAVAARLRDVMQLLHSERIRQGLSLADVQARAGIARSALSRLETEPDANPTLTTLTRYAEALGKDLQILLADKTQCD